ncbi:hypothetical protein [Bacillus sp. FSL R5-0659]|uniref:hypothetical protein n=1 Tax=Bacillus sp. FSL R5-0659 TaxID=2954590 RepID=UPI0030F5CD3D
MFNAQQEKALEVLDDLVESGVDLTKLRKELSTKKFNADRKRLYRAFGGLKESLIAYGLFDSTAVPSEIELNRCFSVDGDYRVVENNYVISYLKALCNLSDIDFKRIKGEAWIKAQREALDSYVRAAFPHGLLYSTLEKKGKYHIKHYINKFYNGNIRNICIDCGLDINLLTDCGSRSASILNGRKFENLVKRILDALYPGEVNYQVRVDDSIPDFIVDSIGWVDAKLNKNTVFNRRCSTITKYLKHTDKLTIIYAIDKPMHNSDTRVTLLSVEYFKRDLKLLGRFDLYDEIDVFISNCLKTGEVVA